MGKIVRFEELIAWQKAKHLMVQVYAFTGTGKISKDFRFCAQIQSAAISVMSNIAEGFERNRPAEFHQFLSVAKGSCGEVRSLLYAAKEIGYLDQDKFDALKSEAE